MQRMGSLKCLFDTIPHSVLWTVSLAYKVTPWLYLGSSKKYLSTILLVLTETLETAVSIISQ